MSLAISAGVQGIKCRTRTRAVSSIVEFSLFRAYGVEIALRATPMAAIASIGATRRTQIVAFGAREACCGEKVGD
jgi:hypothetical protein